MKRNSRQIRAAEQFCVSLLLAAAGSQAGVTDSWAQDSPTIQTSPHAATVAATRLNPTNHPITLTIAAMDGTVYLGDIVITIGTDDRMQFSPDRVVDLLSNTANKATLDNLRAQFAGKSVVTPDDFANTGVVARYNAQTLQLSFDMPAELKTARTLSVAPSMGAPVGTFVQPANFSAYLNVRGSVDYVDRGADTGLQDPVFFLDGAAWSHGIALESEGVWQPGASGSDFQRQGSRFVYDDTGNIARWALGDLQPVGQGFQSVPELSGISVFRSYGVLDPLRSVRPSGDQTFQLTRPSNVSIFVNGTLVRRMRLDPGNYNLRDFPFAQGGNDISVTIEDDTGRQETLRFNVFFNQSQLDAGLSEFGFFAGFKSPLNADGRDYSHDWEITGYYRRGLSQVLTAGVNVQADKNSWLGGGQVLFASPIGTFGVDAAYSHLTGFSSGYAATFTYQRLFEFKGTQGDSLNLAYTTRSRDFAPVGVIIPENRYDFEVSGGYTHAFSPDWYGSLSGYYSHGRDAIPDVQDYHAIVGYRVTPEVGLTVDGSYQQGVSHDGPGLLVSLTWTPAQSSSVRADLNTRNSDARLSYQNVSGTGVGSYNISADLERSDTGAGLNGFANYVANRAEIGVSHFTTFDDGSFSNISDQRTSARIATSFGYADGAVSMGRPVSQAFAIVEGHKTLGNAEIEVNPSSYGMIASTDTLGTAMEGDLSAYVPRTLTVEVPAAPPGYDLGTGSFRLMPPYRAGYNLQVGSDYTVTAIGRLLDANGEPVVLLAGTATEVDNPGREPIAIFTNGQGKFGIAGLKPGRWRIAMPTAPETTYILDIPAGAVGVVRAGELKPNDVGK